MSKKEIEFYLKLTKRIKYAPFIWLVFILGCLLNSLFQFYPNIDVYISLVASFFGLILLGESYYKETDIAKCQKIIENLVNSDPGLLKQINAQKNA